METLLDNPTITKETKKLLLDLIKSVDVADLTVSNEEYRKWYRFGAFDYAKMLADKVNDLPIDHSQE